MEKKIITVQVNHKALWSKYVKFTNFQNSPGVLNFLMCRGETKGYRPYIQETTLLLSYADDALFLSVGGNFRFCCPFMSLPYTAPQTPSSCAALPTCLPLPMRFPLCSRGSPSYFPHGKCMLTHSEWMPAQSRPHIWRARWIALPSVP